MSTARRIAASAAAALRAAAARVRSGEMPFDTDADQDPRAGRFALGTCTVR